MFCCKGHVKVNVKFKVFFMLNFIKNLSEYGLSYTKKRKINLPAHQYYVVCNDTFINRYNL